MPQAAGIAAMTKKHVEDVENGNKMTPKWHQSYCGNDSIKVCLDKGHWNSYAMQQVYRTNK